MSNMSYCMFHNTLGDLDDCYDVMGDEDKVANLSKEEKRKYEKLIKLCVDIACDFGNCIEED